MSTPPRPALALLLGASACSDYALEGKEDHGGTEGTPETDPECLPTAVAGYSGPSDATCANPVIVGTFEPVVEWAWTASTAFPGYDQVMATPAVGDVDGDGLPDIVFSAFAGQSWNSSGTLVSLAGDGSRVNFEVANPGGFPIQGAAAPAIGDLEGDGRVDICTTGSTAAVVCLEGDGTFKWAAGSEISHFGAPSLADLDGDGRSEVILGRQVFGADGSVFGVGSEGRGSQSAWWDGTDTAMSFAVDLDGDGLLEVVAGNAVYERDGSLVWWDGGEDGFPAVADFDGDGAPEVVKVSAGSVSLTDADGALRWSVRPGFAGNGGPPTVADFDGDGAPEIGVAGADWYMVLRGNGTVLWQAPVVDASSNMTGSSVFDFEGDGAAEVVYADEHTVWVFDGATGEVEMAAEGHASATAFEYPVIADVDADGAAEIVFGSNNTYIAGWNGLRVIGDAGSSWQPGRPLWNQHAYHITNVDDDGGIPAVQVPNWSRFNNFRSGDLATGFGTSLPDLVVAEGAVCEAECDAGRLVVWVHAGNIGAVEAEPGAVLTLSGVTGGSETMLGTVTLGGLPSGAYADAHEFDVAVGGVDSLVARIVPAAGECDAENNEVRIDGPFCR